MSHSAILRMSHFAGTRNSLWLPSSEVRAPTTWSTLGSSSSTRTRSGMRSLGYVMSASVHTTMSPRACWVPMRRTVPAPPLRRNDTTRTLSKSTSAFSNTSSVESVDASSTAMSSYS